MSVFFEPSLQDPAQAAQHKTPPESQEVADLAKGALLAERAAAEQSLSMRTVTAGAADPSFVAERVAVAGPARAAPSSAPSHEDPVLDLFQTNRLLVRGMEQEVTLDYDLDNPKPKFRSYLAELDLIAEGRLLASCTLLVPGHKIPTYKSYGYIFNPEDQIYGCYENDCVSAKTADDFIAPEEGKLTLPALAERITATKPIHMNEVLMKISRPPIGLFLRDKAPHSDLIDLFLIKDMMEKKYRTSFPIYIYSRENGTMIRFEDSERNRETALRFLKQSGSIGAQKAKDFRRFLIFS